VFVLLYLVLTNSGDDADVLAEASGETGGDVLSVVEAVAAAGV